MSNLNEKIYIGIDVSKETLDVYVLPQKKYYEVKNNAKEIKAFLKKMSDLQEHLIVMEATGGYEGTAKKVLQQAGLKVNISNPRRIRDFAKALGYLAKTDAIDAKVIAQYAMIIQPEPSAMLDEAQEEISEHSSRRRQLIDMITMEKNRLDKSSKGLKKSIKRIIKALEKELKNIDEKVEKCIAENDKFTERKELLTTIKGVGKVTTACIIADLPELGQIGPKQIAALVGVAPYNCDSGNMKGKRVTYGGRVNVRCALYMATLVASRYNPQIKQYYQRLCAKGKKKKVALVACMHKLLIIMNAMVKNNEPWRCEAI